MVVYGRADDSTGGVKDEMGLSKHRRRHGWTCSRRHGNAVFCSFEQSDIGSLPIIETQKSRWNEKRRHCLGPWSLTQPGVRISLAMS